MTIPAALIVACKTCGWDGMSALTAIDEPIWPSSSVAEQAALLYTIYTGHMQEHILHALYDVEEAIAGLTRAVRDKAL